MNVLYIRKKREIVKKKVFPQRDDFAHEMKDFMEACRIGENWQNQDEYNNTFKVRDKEEE